MNTNRPKSRRFTPPLHVLWAIVFIVIFVKMLPAVSETTIDRSNSVGSQLLNVTPSLSGAPNAVTAVVVFFRGLDTLGEVSVLFLVATALGMVLGSGIVRSKLETKPNEVLAHSKTLVLPHFLLTGLYITIHGHLTPGGGFQGGVMAAGMALLMILAADRIKQTKALHFLEGLAGSVYALVGISGIWLVGSFLGNFLPFGEFGTLFSAGIIPVLYIFIGLKVGTEVIGIYQNFQPQEEA